MENQTKFSVIGSILGAIFQYSGQDFETFCIRTGLYRWESVDKRRSRYSEGRNDRDQEVRFHLLLM